MESNQYQASDSPDTLQDRRFSTTNGPKYYIKGLSKTYSEADCYQKQYEGINIRGLDRS